MLPNRQCDTPPTTPVATLAMLTVADTAAGLSPEDSRMLDDVGPKPMPSAPSTNDAAKPARATSRMSFIAQNLPDYRILRSTRFDVLDAIEKARRALRSVAVAMTHAVIEPELLAAWRARRGQRPRAVLTASRSAPPCAPPSGQVFVGCNVENAAYPQGTCAEAGAIAAMVAEASGRST